MFRYVKANPICKQAYRDQFKYHQPVPLIRRLSISLHFLIRSLLRVLEINCVD